MDILNNTLSDNRWLCIQSSRPTKEFKKVANKIVMDNKEWDEFWKEINQKISIISNLERKTYRNIKLINNINE